MSVLRGSQRAFAALLTACVAGVCLPAAASAQESEARRVYEQRFKESLARPADLDAAFKFAEAANAVGEYEAAIGALERMLFFNPNLARVRLELGVLYFRLGSYGQAQSYFKTALEQPGAPEDVKAAVQRFMAEIDKRQRVNQISGFVQVGARYQTNANAGPTNLNVRVLGFDATLDRAFAKRPDWNAFVVGGVRHVLDFDNQRGDTWETVAQTYLAQQAKVSTYDIQAVEVTSGPRLALPFDALPGISVRPYVIGALLGLSDTYYSSTGGVGAAVSLPLPFASLEAGSEYRWRTFHNSRTYPLASEQSGELAGVFATATMPLVLGVRAVVKGGLYDNDADVKANGFRSSTLDVAFPFEVTLPFANRPLSVTPSVGGSWYRYKAANILVDPNVKRRDRERHVGLTLEAPVTDLFSVGVQLQMSRNQSNLPNYRYRNFSVAFGPSIRF